MFHDISAFFLFSLVCSVPFIGISTARPNVDSSDGIPQFSQPVRTQGVRTPRSHGRNTRALPARVGTSSFQKRMDPSSNLGIITLKRLKFQSLGMILPVTTAARVLEDFYSSIALKAAGDWQALPRRYDINIQEGHFSLTLASIGDAIPWDFVKALANQLWECAALGIAELFDLVYMNDAGNVAVSISLRLLDGEGSSSDSNTNFREGSVPSVGSPYD